MTMRHKSVSESGKMASILIGNAEFPVWVDASHDLSQGKAISPSEIYVRTMDLRKWWPFELVGWLSNLKKWLNARGFRKNHGKHPERMAKADDATIRQVETLIVAAQHRSFKKSNTVGLNLTLQEYIDMADVLLAHGTALAKAGAPMSWEEDERGFRRMSVLETPITTILKHMVSYMREPIVLEWQNIPHMKFVDWYGTMIRLANGYPLCECEASPAEELDPDFVPVVQNSEEYVQDQIPLELDAIANAGADMAKAQMEVLPPATANDELGVHFNKPFEIEFQIQYRIHLRQPNPDLAAFVEDELSKRLQRTHCSCAGTPDMLSIRYHAEDVATPVDKATSADALLGFPEFAQAIIDIIKARLEIEAKMKEMENRIV